MIRISRIGVAPAGTIASLMPEREVVLSSWMLNSRRCFESATPPATCARVRSSSALQAADLRALVSRIRGRSDLDEDAAIRLVNNELKAARAARA